MNYINALLHLAFAFSLTIFCAAGTYWMAHHVRIMDIPNHRSMHSVATPKSGGIAIVATFLLGSILIYRFASVARIAPNYFFTFLGGGIALAAVSLFDDIKQKSFLAKLGAQALCAVAVCSSGLILVNMNLPGVGAIELGRLGYVITLFWIIGLTNAYNFMDGMDGLVGGVGFIAASFLCALALHENSAYVYMTSYVLAAGLAGFLVFNFPPAKIFMGDVGSAFVGYAFAVLALIAASFDQSHLSFYVVPLLLFQILFDTSFTLVRRLLKREKIYEPHRTHLYQLAAALGYSQKRIIIFQYAVAVAQGIGAYFLILLPPDMRPVVFVPFLIFNAYYAYWIILRAKNHRLL